MAHRFGRVANGQMLLNAAGLMVDKWIKELESKFLIFELMINFIDINEG